MTASAAPRTLGIHHAGLTVPDIAATRAFFIDALGFSQVGEVPDYPAVFVSDGTVMLTLWQVQVEPEAVVDFDRRSNVGLHHFALRVANEAALAELARELGARDDVSIEFEPEALGGTPIRHMMCTIPGGVRMELIALPE